MDVLFFLVGAAIVTITALDIFQAVIVPRPTGRPWQPSSIMIRLLWRTWGFLAGRMKSAYAREELLGGFAPVMLVVLLIAWIAALIVGYGAMFYALRGQIKPVPDFSEALYFAGTSLLTIGYGDFAPVGGAMRFLSLAAGASGLGAFAIITAFLFAIFGSYQQREAFVVVFSNRAGKPPSAVDMIAEHARLDLMDDLLETILASQLWLAQLMETHLAYPVLFFFRSTHEGISWVAVVGAILDSSTLALTTLDVKSPGAALMVNRLARQFIDDFAAFFRLEPSTAVGIDRAEFDGAYDRLREVGIALRDRDDAWEKFSAMRATYAGRLTLIAQFLRIPPGRWVGDRSLLRAQPAKS